MMYGGRNATAGTATTITQGAAFVRSPTQRKYRAKRDTDRLLTELTREDLIGGFDIADTPYGKNIASRDNVIPLPNEDDPLRRARARRRRAQRYGSSSQENVLTQGLGG